MNQGPPSPASLDDILNQTRHLLLSFDGPICPLSVHTPSPQITNQLRASLAQQNIALSSEIEQTTDWREMLIHAAATSQQLAETIEAELTKIESAAVRPLRPALHLHELATACRDSGHSITAIGDISATVIHSYLEEHSLDNAIARVIARTPHEVAVAKHDQIDQAINGLRTAPATCTFLTATPTDITTGWRAGTRSIGYARITSDRADLVSAEAEAIISSLAELTLRFRAQYGTPGL